MTLSPEMRSCEFHASEYCRQTPGRRADADCQTHLPCRLPSAMAENQRIMSCLVSLPQSALESILTRLADSHWYQTRAIKPDRIRPRPRLSEPPPHHPHQGPIHQSLVQRESQISYTAYGVKADRPVSQPVPRPRILLRLRQLGKLDQAAREPTNHLRRPRLGPRQKVTRCIIPLLQPFLLVLNSQRQINRRSGCQRQTDMLDQEPE